MLKYVIKKEKKLTNYHFKTNLKHIAIVPQKSVLILLRSYQKEIIRNICIRALSYYVFLRIYVEFIF